MGFLVILAMTKMVMWSSRVQEKCKVESFADYDLVCFFKCQLKVKIRCDRKRLHPVACDRRWIKSVHV